MAALLRAMQAKGPSDAERRWTLADGYRGIEHAQVVVINVRSAAERRRGEAMLSQIARLREDEDLFRDVIGWSGHRIPITAVVADLRDPKDPAVRRAVTRIKRAFASRL